MELLEQCRIWHDQDEFEKIIDALERIPEQERTPELDSELARAYNNLADGETPKGRAMLRRAIALLTPHEAYLREDHCWNFRMGYAYFYLNQEGRALPYFQQALTCRPGDEDTQEFIRECRFHLSLPRFRETFRERTRQAWAAFAAGEEELRRMMDEDRDHRRGEELIAKCSEYLELAFDQVSFEIGSSGGRYELILTPEGDRLKFFQLMYFKRHAPASVLEHWNILVGRQPTEHIGLRSGDWEITGEDVQVWPEKQEDGGVDLTLYCERLAPALKEQENRVWWMLTTLTDQVLGEIPCMRAIGGRFEVAERPKEGACVLLSELPAVLEEMGIDLSTDPETYLESYTGYRQTPSEDPEADWRMDVIAGSTSCLPLVNGYLRGEADGVNDLHDDGAAAGFFCYPLDSFSGEDRSQQIFQFRDGLEAVLEERAGAEAITLVGGATGIFYGYVDVIAWDLPAVLDAAKEFFECTSLPWAGFHVFRRDADMVTVMSGEEEPGESSGGAGTGGRECFGDAEPSPLAEAMMDYLDCGVTYFPPMKDDAPIMAAFHSEKQRGAQEGFVPVLVPVDEILWESLVMNSRCGDGSSSEDEELDMTPEEAADYRRRMLELPVKNGGLVLQGMVNACRENAESYDLDWEKDVMGEMEGGEANRRFSGYWDLLTGMTQPLLLARIPVEHPWEVFAYLPFGGWNECPGTVDLMAAAKYWFEQYGAVPAVIAHDVLEFDLPVPVPEERAMELAAEQYGFCPDIVDQGPEGATVGWLADSLRQSDKWYFWWD